MSNDNMEDFENVISDEIRNILKSHKTCETISDEINNYLQSIVNKMNYQNMPEVVVENEGPFITINFFTKEGDRLETLGDMLEFMENENTDGE